MQAFFQRVPPHSSQKAKVCLPSSARHYNWSQAVARRSVLCVAPGV